MVNVNSSSFSKKKDSMNKDEGKYYIGGCNTPTIDHNIQKNNASMEYGDYKLKCVKKGLLGGGSYYDNLLSSKSQKNIFINAGMMTKSSHDIGSTMVGTGGGNVKHIEKRVKGQK